jgi:hypothetical protein
MGEVDAPVRADVVAGVVEDDGARAAATDEVGEDQRPVLGDDRCE